MPLPSVRSGEKQNSYVSRCISFLADEDSSLNQDQRVAACYSKWRSSKNKEDNPFPIPPSANPSTISGNYEEVPEFPKGYKKPKTQLEELEEDLKIP